MFTSMCRTSCFQRYCGKGSEIWIEDGIKKKKNWGKVPIKKDVLEETDYLGPQNGV